jgi:hypothetical protein
MTKPALLYAFGRLPRVECSWSVRLPEWAIGLRFEVGDFLCAGTLRAAECFIALYAAGTG